MSTIESRDIITASDWRGYRDKLADRLQRFTGTSQYFRGGPLHGNIVYTDGVQYLLQMAAEGRGAYWLLDAIASHRHTIRRNAEGLVFWRLTRERPDEASSPARLVCARDFDSKGEPVDLIGSQDIEYTDIGLASVEIWQAPSVLDGRDVDVLYLRTEH
ncbi:MAG TPA: hypothetical protein VKA74_09815 [Myxococcota bacterium]|nr:hypothetical protein [Myxococcota bacterium]HKK93379.1 hypothetical protein [Longimicrobiales bacterium]